MKKLCLHDIKTVTPPIKYSNGDVIGHICIKCMFPYNRVNLYGKLCALILKIKKSLLKLND